MLSWRRGLGFALILSCLAVTGCSGSAPAKSPAPAPAAPAPATPAAPAPAPKPAGPPDLKGKSVRVIFNSSAELNKVIPVHALHMLEQWGAKVDISYTNNAQITTNAIINNQADVMSISIQGGLSAFNAGVILKLFALAQPRQDYVFVSRPDVKTLADLKGKKVGVLDMAGLNSAHLAMVLEAAKLTQKDVNIIEAGGQGARAAALLAGRLDGTMFGGSNWLTLQPQGYHMLYSYTKEQPKLVDDVWWAKPEWLDKNPEMAQAMNEALLLSYRWFNDPKNKDAFVKETAGMVKGSEDAITAKMYDLYRENNLYPGDAIMNEDAAMFNQSIFVGLKLLPKETPAKDWVETKFAQAALAKLGKSGG